VDPVPAPADGGLLDREQSALDAERAIAAEAETLARSIGLLCSETQALSDRAIQLQKAGVPEAEWLLARFHTHRLETPDLSGPSSQALAAREQALGARARAVEMARVLLQASAGALEEHRTAIARDAAELERVAAAAATRAEEARRAEARKQEEQARARLEALAAAERKRMQRGVAPAAAGAVTNPGGAPASPSVAPRTRTVGQPLGKMTPSPAPNSGRIATRVPLHTQVDFSSDSNVFTGFSTNLSEGGVFVATLDLLPVGTPVDLTFTLPGSKRVTVKGEVRWTREIDDRMPDVFPGVGVRFVDLTSDATAALHRFVAERDPLFYPE